MKNKALFFILLTALVVAAAEQPPSLEGEIERLNILIEEKQRQGADVESLVSQYNSLIAKQNQEQESKQQSPKENKEDTEVPPPKESLKNKTEAVAPSLPPLNPSSLPPISLTLPQPLEARVLELEKKMAALEIRLGAISSPPNMPHAADNLSTQHLAETFHASLPDSQSPALSDYNTALSMLNTNPAQALDMFKRIIMQYPNDVLADKSHIHGGQAALANGKHAEARQLFQGALTKILPQPLLITARLGYARCLLHEKSPQDREILKQQLALLNKEPMTDDQRHTYQQLLSHYIQTP